MRGFIVSAALSSATLSAPAAAQPEPPKLEQPAAVAEQPALKFTPTVITVNGQKLVAFPGPEAEELLDVVERQLPAALALVETQKKVIEAQARLLDVRKQLAEAYLERDKTQREVIDLWKSTAESLARRVEDQEPSALEFVADVLQWIALGVAVYAVVDRHGP